jgi:hypothetical protein
MSGVYIIELLNKVFGKLCPCPQTMPLHLQFLRVANQILMLIIAIKFLPACG